MSKPSAVRAIALTLAIAGGARAAHATTFVAMSERTLARAADAIVLGRVARIESVAGRDGAINTLVAIEIERAYKGRPGDLVVLRQPGGQVGDTTMWIAGSPRFVVGDRDLLFLSAQRDGTARTTAFALGQYRVVADGARVPMAARTLSEAVIGGSRARRLSLARLERIIRRAVAADRGRAVAPLVTVPDEVTAPGLARETHDAFTLMDRPLGRWHEPDVGQPVVYQTAGSDPALGTDASLGALDAAFAAWTNVPGANIVLTRGGATDPAPLLCDGASQIVFNDPFDEMSKPVSCSGVLALGGYCTSAQTDEVSGRTFYRITEGNITMNNGFGGCGFWNQTNVAEVLTHELGHTIGIGHSSEDDNERNPVLSDATMYYRAHFDGRGASLHADDIDAVRAVYPAGFTGDPNVDDVDGDGVVDAQDDCPALADEAQTDSDGDGIGDLCDVCPLVSGTTGCDVILVDRLLANHRGRLLWRGAVALDVDTRAPLGARALLVGRGGVLVDQTIEAPLARGARRLRFRDDRVRIALKSDSDGYFRIRVSAHGLPLDLGGTPLVSASLQVGARSYSGTLSCSRRGGTRLVCRS